MIKLFDNLWIIRGNLCEGKASCRGVVAVLTEDVEDGLLLFGRELVVSAVVAPEVGLAAEVEDDLRAQAVVVLLLHVGKERSEAPCQTDDAKLAEQRALVVETDGIHLWHVFGADGYR